MYQDVPGSFMAKDRVESYILGGLDSSSSLFTELPFMCRCYHRLTHEVNHVGQGPNKNSKSI